MDTSHPLVHEVFEVIDAAEGTSPQDANALGQVRNRLADPLRIVLAGRVSSGKSTLLNALLKQKIAPTDASECTEVVTWFKHGFPERVEVTLTDGSVRELPLEDGVGLSNISVPGGKIQELRVVLANEVLRDFNLVDTPGFSSGRENRGNSEEIMDRRSREAAQLCDAMVFVFNQTLRADELRVLRDFQVAQPGPASAINSIAALSKADKLTGEGADVFEAAESLAKRYAERHSREVKDVIPVFGLLAESAETGALTNQDAAELGTLAELDSEIQYRLLKNVNRFREESPIAVDSASGLLRKLDLQGVRIAVELVRDGARSAGDITKGLSRLSGIDRLRDDVAKSFAARGQLLRLFWAADTLRLISYRPTLPPRLARSLRDLIERIRFDEKLHEFREMEAFDLLCDGDVTLPEMLEADLRRLALNSDPVLRLGAEDDSAEGLRQAAIAGVARWRAIRMNPKSANDEVARTVIRSYTLALSATQ